MTSKNNCCTKAGNCAPVNGAPACTFYDQSMMTGLCLYLNMRNGECLSPFALMDALGKANYCSPQGNCTCANYEQESACAFYDQGLVNGICIKRAWCDVCCSADALKAAKAAALMVAA